MLRSQIFPWTWLGSAGSCLVLVRNDKQIISSHRLAQVRLRGVLATGASALWIQQFCESHCFLGRPVVTIAVNTHFLLFFSIFFLSTNSHHHLCNFVWLMIIMKIVISHKIIAIVNHYICIYIWYIYSIYISYTIYYTDIFYWRNKVSVKDQSVKKWDEKFKD